MAFTYEAIAGMIDHALLTPTQTDADLDAGCRRCAVYGVKSVCIKPYYVSRCAALLAGSITVPSTVIAFPHGSQPTSVKVAECRAALADGAAELDVVVNIGKVLSRDWSYVEADLEAMAAAVREAGRLIKVIFENCFLAEEHKLELCRICAAVGVDFVKTSTGFGTGGATLDDLRLMRTHSPDRVAVKASGGIKTLDQILEMRALGVTRIGTSRTFALLEDCRQRLGLTPLGESDGETNSAY